MEQTQHKLGGFYKDSTNEIFILASTATNTCALISLRDGNRYKEPIEVEGISDGNISSDDFYRVGTRNTLNPFVRISAKEAACLMIAECVNAESDVA